MNCVEVNDLIQQNLDIQLRSEEQARLHAHIEVCTDCKSFYERLRTVHLDLESLPKVSLPYSIVDKLLPSLHQLKEQNDASDGSKNRSRLFLPHSWLRISTAVAASILVIFTLTQLLQHDRGEVQFLSSPSPAAMNETAEQETVVVKQASEMEVADQALKIRSADDKAYSIQQHDDGMGFGVASITSTMQAPEMMLSSPDGTLVTNYTDKRIEIWTIDQQLLLQMVAEEDEYFIDIHWVENNELEYTVVGSTEAESWSINTLTMEKTKVLK